MNETITKIFYRLKAYAKTNILFITFIITSIINSTLLRVFTVHNTFAIKPIIADLTVILVVGSFGYFFKPKHRFRYFLLWSVIFTAVCMINSVYYSNYLSFASFSLLATLTQLGGYTDAVFENILEPKDLIFLWQIFVLIIVHIQLKANTYYKHVEEVEVHKIRFLNTIVVTLILLGFFISMLTGVDISRLKKQWNREYIVQEFGIYVFQANDLVSCVKTKLNSMFGYDEAAREFREFYAELDTNKEPNQYTGIFEGKNVIVIHAESIQNFLISDDNRGGEPTTFNGIEVTPNLNRLAQEGIYFSNFYSQESAGTSSDTEFTYNASLLPSSSGTVFMNYFDREYITTPKLLKDKGYYTFSMHGNKGSAWNRTVVHPNLGYDHFYYYDQAYTIDEVIELGLSDKSFFSQSVDIIKDIDASYDQWYGLLIMLSNHTPFSDINNYAEETGWNYSVDYTYEQLNEETGVLEAITVPYMEDTKLGNYFKSAHYADEAIGELIAKLENEGLLDDTVIVIYGDHDNKLKKSEYNRYYNYDPYTDSIKDSDEEGFISVDEYFYELNRSVPFIIWTPSLKDTKYNQEITEVMGMIDIEPTLGNMFGFTNDYALGHDIFSVEDNVVVFPSGNWLTEKIYYNSAKEAYRQLESDAEITLEYIEYYNAYAENLISISNNIITYDLIERLVNTPEDTKLEEYKVNASE